MDDGGGCEKESNNHAGLREQNETDGDRCVVRARYISSYTSPAFARVTRALGLCVYRCVCMCAYVYVCAVVRPPRRDGCADGVSRW